MNSRPLAIFIRTARVKPGVVAFELGLHHCARLNVDGIAGRFARISHPDVKIMPVDVSIFVDHAKSQVLDPSAKIRGALRDSVRRVAHALDCILKIGVASFGHDDVGYRDAAARLQYARHLGERALRFGHVMKRVAAGNDSGGAVRKRQRVNIGARKFDVGDAIARGFGASLFDHSRSEVRANRMAHAGSQRTSIRSGSAREIDGQELFGIGQSLRRASGEFFGFLGSGAAHGAGENVRGLCETFANFFLMLGSWQSMWLQFVLNIFVAHVQLAEFCACTDYITAEASATKSYQLPIRLTVETKIQRARCSGPAARSSGIAAAHSAMRSGQRGSNAQPGGSAVSDGTVPAIGSSLWRTSCGEARSNPAV